MAALLRKYGTATAAGTHIRVPIVKVQSQDYATSSDWTPAAGDVKLSKDGGSETNIGTLPTYTNGAWQFQLTAAELQCKTLTINVVDSATKAIEDQFIIVETYGHASALHPFDLGTAMSGQSVASVSGAVGSVTGNVGGNVVGSVGSVTGNVGGSVDSVTDPVTVGAINTDVITAASLNADASAEIVATLLATQLAEAYPGTDDEMTLAEALWAIRQLIGDFSISGTGLTVRDSNGDPAMTYVLDDADSPTSRTRNT